MIRGALGGGDDTVARAVAETADPRLFHRLGELEMVRSVTPRRRRTEVVLAVPSGGHPAAEELRQAVADAVARAGGGDVELQFVAMSPDEESALAARLVELGHVAAPPPERHGSAGPTPRPNPFASRASTTRVIAIGSGKGGVGKSSVTVNLAVALHRLGRSVGLLDADVYGFSVPSMLGINDAPRVLGNLLIPPVAYGVRCISIGFFVPEEQAVIWRGPMLHKALEQFLVDVHWGAPDYLLIDLPPGTGDVALSIAQFLPSAELYVVTTPQPAAERVAQRAAVLARQLRLPLRGVIENMSYFTGDDGRRYELFGSGGGEALATSLGVALLAKLPLLPAVREGGDSGRPVAAVDPESEAGTAFRRLAERVDELGPARVYRSELAVH